MADQNAKPRNASGMIDLTGFTAPQNQALLDLVVLAMYMDGNLAKVEEARVQQLLGAMGFDTDYDRNREFDAAVTRVRRHSQNIEAANNCAVELAAIFTVRDQQERIFAFLNDLTALDGRVSIEESKFLVSMKAAFKL